MRIAIYSRGLDAHENDGIKLLLDELARYKIEPVISRISSISFILQLK